MLVFPQLESGAGAQFPLRREARFRTVLLSFADGSEQRAGDLDFERRLWELPQEGLTPTEWQAIEALFEQAEGRLGTFLFLEPGTNLLVWSESFTQQQWENVGGLSITEGRPGPLGGDGAAELSAPSGAGSLRQTLAAPGSFRYAASVWARTSASGAALQLDDGSAGLVSVGFASDNQWRRYSVSWNLASAAEQMSFVLAVPSGASVEVFGPQLESQPYPSQYKRTEAQGGVYAGARFDQDELTEWLTGLGSHAGVVRIAWTRSPI